MNSSADFLPCSTCVELLEHSKSVYKKNQIVYRLTGTDGIPRIWEKSPLNLYPVLQRVCVYTIAESDDEDGDDEEFTLRIASSDPHRPLFYTELSARGFNILGGRVPKKHPLASPRRRRRCSHKI